MAGLRILLAADRAVWGIADMHTVVQDQSAEASAMEASACRNLGPEEQALQADEKALLDQICKAYYLPQWCSINDYQRLMEAKGLQDIRTADWSEEVAPFWGAVIRSALSVEGFKGLFTAGLKTIKVSLSGRVSIIEYCAGRQYVGVHAWLKTTTGAQAACCSCESVGEHMQMCQGRNQAHETGWGGHHGGSRCADPALALGNGSCLGIEMVPSFGCTPVWNRC